MKKDDASDSVLSQVDPGKREFIGKLIGTTTFAVPVIASFAMASMSVAEAQGINGSTPP